jgi:hypothetical protein
LFISIIFGGVFMYVLIEKAFSLLFFYKYILVNAIQISNE